MNLKEYIAMLEAYAEAHPEHLEMEVIFQQDGYYADGDFAELYAPPDVVTLSEPKRDSTGKYVYEEVTFIGKPVKRKAMETKEYLSLGFSYQSY